MTASSSFPAVLADRLRTDPGRPFLTFYDERTGERTELSVTTYANWVAKAASLLVEECELERGDSLAVDLPPHWLGPVMLGAAWSAGLVVRGADAPDVGAAVCGPEGLARWAPRVGQVAVLASALLPLGTRFTDPLPAGVRDVGVEIWSQPDAFVALDPPTADDVAYVAGEHRLTQAELCALEPPEGGTRLLTTADPLSADGVALLCGALRTGGSLVLVVGAEADRRAAIAETEHAIAVA